MSKLPLLLLLLAVGSLCYNNYYACSKPVCKPAIKVMNCYDPHCYKCGPNETFNPDTLYCDCKEGFLPINGFCGKCS